VLLAAALIAGAGVLILGDEGDEGGGRHGAEAPGPPAPAPGAGSTRESQTQLSPGRGNSTRRQVQAAVRASPSPRLDPGQREVARVVEAYVAALNAHDGRRACGLFAPGALSGLDFPRDRGGCADSLTASIGYRDRRGFPVYERSRIARFPAVAIQGSTARVTATTVTRFADNREPSVEDDLIYLDHQAGGWRITKPSATLYRAIGVGDIPPRVLAPP
jgi:hypothetical protein